MSALVHGLAKFKPIIEASPVVMSLVDSQVAYFVFHGNLLDTNLKSKRVGTLLHLQYPNLLVCPIAGRANISDQLSRLFTLPKIIKETISLKKLILPDRIPEIENKAYTLKEARQEITGLGNLHQELKVETKAAAAEQILDSTMNTRKHSNLTSNDKDLLENLQLIQILAERLTKERIIHEQEKLFKSADCDFDLKSPKCPLEIKDMLAKVKDKDLIFIPPDLEGVAISHSHLICGHVGWVRLYSFLRDRYFMPQMKEKSKMISTTCQACCVSNPGCTRKSPSGTVLASYPMEIVTADLLEVESNINKTNHKILVICDYFTKAIFTYDMTSFTAKAFLQKFKDFLSTTGLITKLLIVDNASLFSQKDVLKFLHMIGIVKVQGNANHSQARGLVESSIRILQTLIRKLLSLSDRFNYEELLFLMPILLNRAKNPITGLTPYELLYCRNITDLGSLGRKLN